MGAAVVCVFLPWRAPGPIQAMSIEREGSMIEKEGLDLVDSLEHSTPLSRSKMLGRGVLSALGARPLWHRLQRETGELSFVRERVCVASWCSFAALYHRSQLDCWIHQPPAQQRTALPRRHVALTLRVHGDGRTDLQNLVNGKNLSQPDISGGRHPSAPGQLSSPRG